MKYYDSKTRLQFKRGVICKIYKVNLFTVLFHMGVDC